MRECPEGGFEVRVTHPEGVLVYPNVEEYPGERNRIVTVGVRKPAGLFHRDLGRRAVAGDVPGFIHRRLGRFSNSCLSVEIIEAPE